MKEATSVFQISMTRVRKPSFVFQRYINAPTRSAITPITTRTGAEIAPNIVIRFPIAPPTSPIVIASGPMTAIIIAKVPISCCVPLSRLRNQSTIFCTLSAIGMRAVLMISPNFVPRTSRELFSFSTDPPAPCIMVSAISCVVPSQFSRLSESAFTSSGAVLINASHGAIWFLPKIALAAAICSCSLRFEKLSCSSFCICRELFIVPSLLNALHPPRY